MVHEPTPQPVTFLVAANDAGATSKKNADFVCDGTADEVQIQAAIDALPTLGGIVQLSEGTFNFAAAVTITDQSGIWVRGSGVTTTTLFLSNSANSRMFSINNTVDINGLRFSDFEADGNAANQSDGGDRDDHAMIYGTEQATTEVLNNVLIENLYLHDGRAGAMIRLPDTRHLLITNVYLKNGGSAGGTHICDGMWVGNGQDIHVSDCTFENNTDVGYAQARNTRTTTTNCIARLNDEGGFTFARNCLNGVFTNCVSESNTGGAKAYGFGIRPFLGGTPNTLIISNCVVRDNTVGFWIEDSTNISLLNNFLSGNTTNFDETAGGNTNIVSFNNRGWDDEDSDITANTHTLTITDDVADAGLLISNADGSLRLINATDTGNEFSAALQLFSKGVNQPGKIFSKIPVANDTGTVAALVIQSQQDDNTDLVTRPILSIQNRATAIYTFGLTALDLLGNDVVNIGMLNLNNATRLLIASDIITVTQSFHTVDGAGATDDDLVTINGGTAGDKITLKPDDDAVTITIVDTGNIILAGDADFVMSDIADTWEAIFDGTNWLETSRSSNHV